MSLGRHRAFSRHSATKPELPFLGSFRLASSSTRLPELKVKIGLYLPRLVSSNLLKGLTVLELLLLLPLYYAGFFGWGFSNLPLFDPLGALASLATLSLFVYGLNRGCVREPRDPRILFRGGRCVPEDDMSCPELFVLLQKYL